VDQAVISAASFLTTVMIGRFSDASELGLYSIGFSLLTVGVCVQEALILTPYMVQRHHAASDAADGAAAALAQSGALSAVITAALFAAAWGLSASEAAQRFLPVLWTLAAAAPFLVLRDFGRRFAFVHFRMGEALALDSVGAAVQVALLVWLGWVGQMSAATACAAMGAAAAVTGIVWLFSARTTLTLRAHRLGDATRRNWRLGKWLLATQLVFAVQGLFVYWRSSPPSRIWSSCSMCRPRLSRRESRKSPSRRRRDSAKPTYCWRGAW